MFGISSKTKEESGDFKVKSDLNSIKKLPNLSIKRWAFLLFSIIHNIRNRTVLFACSSQLEFYFKY